MAYCNLVCVCLRTHTPRGQPLSPVSEPCDLCLLLVLSWDGHFCAWSQPKFRARALALEGLSAVEQQAPANLKVLRVFCPDPIPWGAVGTCLRPWLRVSWVAPASDKCPCRGVGILCLTQVWDRGFFATRQLKSSSHSLPPGQRSCLLTYTPIIKGCLQWLVLQICRFLSLL